MQLKNNYIHACCDLWSSEEMVKTVGSVNSIYHINLKNSSYYFMRQLKREPNNIIRSITKSRDFNIHENVVIEQFHVYIFKFGNMDLYGLSYVAVQSLFYLFSRYDL